MQILKKYFQDHPISGPLLAQELFIDARDLCCQQENCGLEDACLRYKKSSLIERIRWEELFDILFRSSPIEKILGNIDLSSIPPAMLERIIRKIDYKQKDLIYNQYFLSEFSSFLTF